MAGRSAKELYRRLAPVLYARAQRALKDPKLAEQLTHEVAVELARLPERLTDAELLKRGRARLAQLCRERSTTALDSLLPGQR